MKKYLLLALFVSAHAYARDCSSDLLNVILTLDGQHSLEARHGRAVIKDLNGVEKFETPVPSEDEVLAGYYNPATGVGIVFTVKGIICRTEATPGTTCVRPFERDRYYFRFAAAAVGTDENTLTMITRDRHVYAYDFRARKVISEP